MLICSDYFVGEMMYGHPEESKLMIVRFVLKQFNGGFQKSYSSIDK